MRNAMMWRAEELSARNGSQASILLREATLDSRLNALRETGLALLREVETLKNAQPACVDPKLNLDDEVKQFEIELIRTALERTAGNQTRAARLLGVKNTTLNAKIKRYKISCAGHHDLQDQEIAG